MVVMLAASTMTMLVILDDAMNGQVHAQHKE